MDPEEAVSAEVEAPEVEAAPVEEPAEVPEREPTTLEAAYQRALAREAEDQAGEEQAETPEAAPEKPEQPAVPTAQQELDRMFELHRQGRDAELTPYQRGVLNRLTQNVEANVVARQSDEKQFRDMYLHYLAMQEEEPDVWADLTSGKVNGQDGNPIDPVRVLQFMAAYKSQHPDVTLDNPDAPTNRRQDVRRDAMVEAYDHIDAAVAKVVGKHGISESDLMAAAEKAQGNFDAYLDGVFQAALKNALDAERPKIAKAEREAASVEVQALKARAIQTAAAGAMSGSAVTAQRAGAKPGSWEAALTRATERVEAAS